MWKSKNNGRLKFQIGLQLWKTWVMLVWTSAVPEKVLERM